MEVLPVLRASKRGLQSHCDIIHEQIELLKEKQDRTGVEAPEDGFNRLLNVERLILVQISDLQKIIDDIQGKYIQV